MEDLLDDPFHSASNPACIPGRRRLCRRRRPRRPVVPGSGERRSAGRPRWTAGRGTGRGDENEEKEEQAEKLERRLEALEAAERRGQGRPAATRRPPRRRPRAGPASSRSTRRRRRLGARDRGRSRRRRGSTSLVTRYGGASRAPATARRRTSRCAISTDGGATFGAGKPLCACKGSRPVRPDHRGRPAARGAVYALYMNGFNVVFTKSTDHGATWSRTGQDLRQRVAGTTSRPSR